MEFINNYPYLYSLTNGPSIRLFSVSFIPWNLLLDKKIDTYFYFYFKNVNGKCPVTTKEYKDSKK